jgi:hypothetical protein
LRRRPDSSPNAFVLGGGLAGLIAADALRKRGANVTIIETQRADNDLFFGSRRFYRTKGMVDLLERFELPYSDFIVRGGIMLRGFVWPYPMAFKGMSAEQAERVNQDHFAKALQTSSGEWGSTAMNREPGTRSRRALRCHVGDLAKALSQGVRHVRGTVKKLDMNSIVVGTERVPYDFAVVTLPLWELVGRATWHIPEATALRLNVAFVVPRRDRFAKWDFVFTPYTPGESIFRVAPIGSGYACEFNGTVEVDRLISDLNFIFPDGFTLAGLKVGLNGHLFPLSERPDWPENVAPIGRVAQWQQMTIDDVVKSATKVADRWLS